MRKLAVFNIDTKKTESLHDNLGSAMRELMSRNSSRLGVRINDTGTTIGVARTEKCERGTIDAGRESYSAIPNTTNPVAYILFFMGWKNFDNFVNAGITLGDLTEIRMEAY